MFKRMALCALAAVGLLAATTGCGLLCRLFGIGFFCSTAETITSEMALGAHVWNSFWTTDAGGSGTPTDSTDREWARCKACHGWDWLAGQGGYVRRNPVGDGSRPAGNVSAALGTSTFTSAAVLNAGGRALSTHDQTHPDYTAILTSAQAAAVVAFLNSTSGRMSNIATIDPTANPVAYTFTGADTTAGQTLYDANCRGCHGDPDADSTAASDNEPGTGGIKAYLGNDGKYSELYHKALWGAPDTIMTRTATGNMTATQVRDLLAYLQTVVEGTGGGGGGGGDATAGAAFYTTHGCTACHASDGSGGIGPDIRTKTAAEILARLDGTNVHTGGTVAGVTQADADNLAAWLATQ